MASEAPPIRHGEVTRILAEMQKGQEEAAPRLVAVVYPELKRLAAAQLRKERREHTLQTTALVHEVFLKMVDQRDATWRGRAHFFAVASQLMRRILVDAARKRNAAKRGAGGPRVPIEDVEPLDLPAARLEDVLAVDLALEKLATFDARQARIVELRFFGGLSIEETAAVLEIAPRTVNREWVIAQAWLRRELEGSAGV